MKDDAVTQMIAEYYRDVNYPREFNERDKQVAKVDFRALVGRYLSRVLGDDEGCVFYCPGYRQPHFWTQIDHADNTFYQRCNTHPERRQPE